MGVAVSLVDATVDDCASEAPGVEEASCDEEAPLEGVAVPLVAAEVAEVDESAADTELSCRGWRSRGTADAETTLLPRRTSTHARTLCSLIASPQLWSAPAVSDESVRQFSFRELQSSAATRSYAIRHEADRCWDQPTHGRVRSGMSLARAREPMLTDDDNAKLRMSVLGRAMARMLGPW